MEKVTKVHWSALHHACWERDLSAVQSTVHLAESLDDQGRSALHVAAMRSDTGPIIRLLGSSFPHLLDALDNNKCTALDLAIQSQQAEAIEALLDVGTRPTGDLTQPSWWTVLCLAETQGRTELLKKCLGHFGGEFQNWELIQTPQKTLFRQRDTGWSLLHAAVDRQREDCARALIGAGHSLDPTDHHKCTPLHLLCRQSPPSEPMLRLFVEAGASLTPHDEEESSPLSLLEKPLAKQVSKWAKQAMKTSLQQAYGDHLMGWNRKEIRQRLMSASKQSYLVAITGIDTVALAWNRPQARLQRIHGPIKHILHVIDQTLLTQWLVPQLKRQHPSAFLDPGDDTTTVDQVHVQIEGDRVFLAYQNSQNGALERREELDWRRTDLSKRIAETKSHLTYSFEKSLKAATGRFAKELDPDPSLEVWLELNPRSRFFEAHYLDPVMRRRAFVKSQGMDIDAAANCLATAKSRLKMARQLEAFSKHWKIAFLHEGMHPEEPFQGRPDLDWVLSETELFWRSKQHGVIRRLEIPEGDIEAGMDLARKLPPVKELLPKACLKWIPAKQAFLLEGPHPVTFGAEDRVWATHGDIDSVMDAYQLVLRLREAALAVQALLNSEQALISWFLRRRPELDDFAYEGKKLIALWLAPDRQSFEVFYREPSSQSLVSIPTIGLDDLVDKCRWIQSHCLR